jgi:hypothetical protein
MDGLDPKLGQEEAIVESLDALLLLGKNHCFNSLLESERH